LQVGDTGPVESARRSNSRVLGSPFSGLSGHLLIYTANNFGFMYSHKGLSQASFPIINKIFAISIIKSSLELWYSVEKYSPIDAAIQLSA
jgi:hypothetical protein